nr:DUF6207 family protein [Streptomyces sp. A1499]
MKPISEAHVAQPGVAVVGVAACDDQTVFAVQALLAGCWATASARLGCRASRVSGCAATSTSARGSGLSREARSRLRVP